MRYKFEHAYNIRRFLRLLWKHPVRHEATLINSLLTVHDYSNFDVHVTVLVAAGRRGNTYT